MNQTSIFDMLYDKYKITKPIRLIEFFAGYGSQALALKYLGVPFEHWKTCEWAVKSIQAYKDIHYQEDNEDYSKNMSLDQIKSYLYNKGISANYNEPMNEAQVNRLNEKQSRTIYNNIIATNNLVNIQQVKGKDLDIEETDKYCYILTYSFPCQDLSLAGKGKGMSDTTTRSGMLWEVERILTECHELGNLPQVLLMENVPQVHSQDNIADFHKWQLRLEELGYSNYMQDLIATDYGIPQTRNRCFMISILGDYSYTFPQPIPLKLKLKDMLEDEVDEKYYLSDKMLEYITSKDDKYQVNENKLVINRDIACSKTTREGNTRADTTDYICDDLPDNYNIGCKQLYDLNYYNHEQSNRVYSTEANSPTLRTKYDEAGAIKIEDNRNVIRKYGIFDKENQKYQAGSVYDEEEVSPTLDTCSGGYRQPMIEKTIKIKNATKQGYLEAEEGDGINLSSRMEYQRGNVQKQMIQTIDTMGGESKGVVVKDKSLYTETEKALFTKDGNIKRYLDSDIIDKFEEGQMATTTFPNGYGHGPRTHNESVALNTIDKPSVKHNLRIRKLTPYECFALMGVKREDYLKCAKNQSDSSLYHLAGDSIVVNVLMAIFGEML